MFLRVNGDDFKRRLKVEKKITTQTYFFTLHSSRVVTDPGDMDNMGEHSIDGKYSYHFQ